MMLVFINKESIVRYGDIFANLFQRTLAGYVSHPCLFSGTVVIAKCIHLWLLLMIFIAQYPLAKKLFEQVKRNAKCETDPAKDHTELTVRLEEICEKRWIKLLETHSSTAIMTITVTLKYCNLSNVVISSIQDVSVRVFIDAKIRFTYYCTSSALYCT